MSHYDQILRIRAKLKSAKEADRNFKVFGANSHKYQIGRPASEDEVCAFEDRYSLVLPACYRSFLREIGNGGPSYRGSAAGPFYGIYPLGEGTTEIVDNPVKYLSKSLIIEPDMTDEKWAALKKSINEDDISDKDYEVKLGEIYGGLLPIGSQGCTYLHAIVLNGPHKGRVVNLDQDGQKPTFTFEKNFLDWYERWLDEVIAGYLLQDGPISFGYTMGGDDKLLMRVYDEADSRKTKLDALKGIAKLININEETSRKLLGICSDGDKEISHFALRMLTKFAYHLAREPLGAHITGSDDDCLLACQSIRWYAKKHAKEWVELLKTRLPKVSSPETFRFISYLLVDSGVDFGEDVKPFCTHENAGIRMTAFHALGQLKTKRAFVDLFIVGLDDTAPMVVVAALQSLAGIHDQRLPGVYRRLLEKNKDGNGYVLSNLELRMEDMKMGFFDRLIERFHR